VRGKKEPKQERIEANYFLHITLLKFLQENSQKNKKPDRRNKDREVIYRRKKESKTRMTKNTFWEMKGPSERLITLGVWKGWYPPTR